LSWFVFAKNKENQWIVMSMELGLIVFIIIYFVQFGNQLLLSPEKRRSLWTNIFNAMMMSLVIWFTIYAMSFISKDFPITNQVLFLWQQLVE
jgi:hypothetical protein